VTLLNHRRQSNERKALPVESISTPTAAGSSGRTTETANETLKAIKCYIRLYGFVTPNTFPAKHNKQAQKNLSIPV